MYTRRAQTAFRKIFALTISLFLLVPYSVVPFATSAQTSCPLDAANLLGSGCHDMGTAWFNGAMDQYVNYGGASVYYCSTNYISGCSTGGGAATPPAVDGTCSSELTALLGSGCHNMGNAYFDGAMTKYVYPGSVTVYECSKNLIDGCSTSGTIPTYNFWVDAASSFPKYGEYGVSLLPTLRIIFSKEIDASTVHDANVFLTEGADPTKKIIGTISLFTSGFDFKPVGQLAPGTLYRFVVKNAVRAKDGSSMAGDYYVEFTTGQSTQTGSASLSGSVLDAFGKPVSGAYVSLYTADYLTRRDVQSLSDGTYTITNIPPGTYQLKLYPPQLSTGLIAPTPQAVSLGEGDTLVKDLLFTNTTKTIRGVVTRADNTVVTDAQVGAYQKENDAWTDTRTDAAGSYTLRVRGGEWVVGVQPSAQPSNWFFGEEYPTVLFANDDAPEEKIVNFQVSSAGSKIVGIVLTKDGTPPSANTVFVEAKNGQGVGNGGSVGADGGFTVSVSPGTYALYVRTQDPSANPPFIPLVTVKEGEVVNIGTVFLGTRPDVIRGAVLDENNIGIAGVSVSAYQAVVYGVAPSGYATTRTDSAGNYTLQVVPGSWFVNATPDTGSGYFNPKSPQGVTVVSGVPTVVNFALVAGTATITGVIQDETGTVVSDVYGFAKAVNLAATASREDVFGAPIERGQFTMKIPAGTYMVTAHLPPDSSYAAEASQTVTATAGKITNISLGVQSSASRITGFVFDANGQVVTGIPVEIFASSQGGWKNVSVDKTTGAYTLRVAPGEWLIGAWVDPSSGYSVGEYAKTVLRVTSGQTVKQNFVLTKADAAISGKATKPNGDPFPGVFIKISTVSYGGIQPVEGSFSGPSFVAGLETDATGMYAIRVPAGTYYVNAFLPSSLGLMGPEEQGVTVQGKETAVVNLPFRTPSLTVSGKVLLSEAGTEAFVWAWSEKGGFVQTRSDENGNYTLNVVGNTTWRVSAAKEEGTTPYKSPEVLVVVKTFSVIQNLELVAASFTLASPKIEKISAGTVAKVETSDGAAVTLPATSLATGGAVTVRITPSTEVPTQGTTKIVGVGYDIEARDESGVLVTKLNKAATVEIPYLEQDLAGIAEDRLQAAFWDETIASWREIENSIVDVSRNVVTALVDHFTRFAIVAAADVSAPTAPANVKAVPAGNGAVRLSWINPLFDFHHVKIYRSEQGGKLGSIVFSDLTGAAQEDSGLANGTTYYYTVRAVDPAGNESVNAAQVSVVAVGASVKQPVSPPAEIPVAVGAAALSRTLYVGAAGEDVRVLQRLLNVLGFTITPSGAGSYGNESAYFGGLTKLAVITFQEQYADEVLRPLGLTVGTGVVGPATRGKLNALLETTSLAEQKPDVPGLQVAKTRLERNLFFGMSGDDISALQELLVKEEVYPEKLITGYFGHLTTAAIIRLQEKYRVEILTPVGLTAGTGYVGPSTRAKINTLLVNP